MPTLKPPGDDSGNSKASPKAAKGTDKSAVPTLTTGKKESAIQRQMKAAGISYSVPEQPEARVPASENATVRSSSPTVKPSDRPIITAQDSSATSTMSEGARKRIGTAHTNQIEALQSMQDLIAERKRLLTSLLSDKPYRVKTYHEYQLVLGEQQAGWDMIQKRRRAYTVDKQLFNQLRSAINLEFDKSKQYGSFAQHLLNCSTDDAPSEQGKQAALIATLLTRIPSIALVPKEERPVVVRDAISFINRHKRAQQSNQNESSMAARVAAANQQAEAVKDKQATSISRIKSEQKAKEDAAEAIQRREASERSDTAALSDAQLLAAMSGSAGEGDFDRRTFDGSSLADSSNSLLSAISDNDPKLTLVVRMEQLINADLRPQDRAKKVRALHGEWKSQVLADREHNQQLLLRFKKASEMAYAPSRRYYRELAVRLQDNLQKRLKLSNGLKQIVESHQDDTADWEHLAQVLRTAKNQWDEYAPTERLQTKPVRAIFDEQFARINSLLDAELDRNRDNKEHLIDVATSLSRQKASKETAPALAAIGQQWVDVGLTRDSDDQSLDHKFSDLCALVDTQNRAYLREIELQRASAKRAQNLIDRVQAYTNKEGQDLLGSNSAIDLIMAEFPAMNTLPESEAQAIHENMEAAHAAYLAKIEATKAAQRAQAKADFHQASELVNKVETAYIENVSVDELARLLKRAQDFVASVKMWPRKGELLLRQRLKNIQDIKA